MKKKVLALSLTAALAISSTTAFAAEKACTSTSKYDFSNLLKSYSSKFTNSNTNYNVTVNGKTVDLNSIDCNALLNNKQKPAEKDKYPNTAYPVHTKPDATQPEDTAAQEPEAPAIQKPETNSNANTAVSSYEQKVAELVNVEREKEGLPALKLDSAISNVARLKSKDMADNNYFAHQSPTYGSAGNMLSQFGIKWSAWGENIASGQRTPESVVTAWMNSSGHRANILSSNYSKIGVGYVINSNGTPYWTQMFTN